MVKARVRKSNSSKVLKEEEETIIRLQDEIFNYADKHNFYLNFLDMSSEAFKDKDPNPWLTIAKKACLLGGTTYEEFISSGIIKQYEHEISLKKAKLDWYISKFGNFDHEFAFESDKLNAASKSDNGNSNRNNTISPAPSTQTSFSSLSPITPKRQNSPAVIKENPSKLIENVQIIKPFASIEKNTALSIEKKKASSIEKPQSALKLKLLLPEDAKEFSVITSDLRRTLSSEEYQGLMRDKEIDVAKTIKDTPPLKLKLNLRDKCDKPMTKIPETNLHPCINEFSQPQKLNNIFALKRKVKKSPIKNETNEQAEAIVVKEPVENVKEVNETLFKLKIKLPTVSEVTITNAEVTTPTGNILLPPIIAFDSGAKSDNEEQPMDIDFELKKENSLETCTSEDLFPNIENEMKLMFEEKQTTQVETKENHNVIRTPILNASEITKINAKEVDSLILTQKELLEIEEIAALKFTSSTSSIKSSEDIDDHEMKTSPIKTSTAVQNLSEEDHVMEISPVKASTAVPNSIKGGKNLSLIVLKSIKNSCVNDVTLEITPEQSIVAIETESSEEINLKIDEKVKTPNNDNAMNICDGNHGNEAVSNKPKVCTLGSDDFEPDYEP